MTTTVGILGLGINHLFEKVEMTDHEFAKFLFGKDRNWTWVPRGRVTQFRDSKGKLLAVCIYDNAACTHNTYLPKETK